ncbi:MAG: hypothetical protein ACOY90_14330 [Candidatus Zhuqueibacterota bacterium]
MEFEIQLPALIPPPELNILSRDKSYVIPKLMVIPDNTDLRMFCRRTRKKSSGHQGNYLTSIHRLWDFFSICQAILVSRYMDSWAMIGHTHYEELKENQKNWIGHKPH